MGEVLALSTRWLSRSVLVGALVLTLVSSALLPRASAATSYTLSVTVQGAGSVKSGDGKVSCPPDCVLKDIPGGTIISLIATAQPGALFSAWKGEPACGAKPACDVDMSGDRDITATFVPVPSPTAPPPPTLPGVTITAPGVPPTGLPTVTIVTPANDTLLSRRSTLVTGTVTAPAVALKFCVIANAPPTFPVSGCDDVDAIGADGTYQVNISGLRTGSNTITAWVEDVHHARASAQISVRVGESDFTVLGIEVTQGSQVRDLPEGPGPSSGVHYNGVNLAADGRTIVRVYAGMLGGPFETLAGVPVVLYGFRERSGGSDPLGVGGTPGPLAPEFSPTIGRRPIPFNLETLRRSATSAHNFVLPPSWTVSGHLRLEAVVNPPESGPALAECAGCAANNRSIVTGIPFYVTRSVGLRSVCLDFDPSVASPALPRTMTAQGCEVTGVPLGGHRSPPEPSQAFSDLRAILPLAESGFVTSPRYDGRIDVSDIVRCNDEDRRRFGDCATAVDKSYRMADRVDAWEAAYLHGTSPGDYRTLGLVVGQINGVAPPRPRSIWPWDWFDVRNGAANSDRPLTSVAHEYLHLWGFWHASGCNGASPSVAWPPDDRGQLNGFGLDRRPGSGGAPGLYRIIGPDDYDLMSYCVVNEASGVWISPRYWNDMLDKRRVGEPAAFHAGPVGDVSADSAAVIDSTDIAVPSPSVRPGQFLLVTAEIDANGQARIVRVQPTGAAPSIPDQGDYVVQELDASGTVVGATHVDAQTYFDGGQYPLRVRAFLPARKAARVEIVKGGNVLGARDRAHPPTIELRDPASAATIPSTGGVSVRWKARDADGDPLMARVDYSIDDGSSWRPLTVTMDSSVVLSAAQLSRTQRGRLRVTVSDGFSETSATSDRLRSPGTGPEVRITSLAAVDSLPADAALYLAGEAYNDRGLPLRGKHLRWLVGGRTVGTGNAVSVIGLPPGTRQVTLEARDSFGRVGRASMPVVLTAVAPTFITLKTPKNVSPTARSLRLRVATNVAAQLRVGRQRVALDREPRSVKVRVKPGKASLQLALELVAGDMSSAVTITVKRG